MDFQGYELDENGDRLLVRGIRDFDPVHVFECGQCFRWQKQADGSYTGVVAGRVVNVLCRDGSLEIMGSTIEEFKALWFNYFDLGRDYGEIKKKLAKMDTNMKAAVEFGHGIRLLRQDLWEMLISFIISANNRIPMIMKIVDAISRMYGDEIESGGQSFHAFPRVEKLAGSCIEELEVCRGGFRCKYILNTSRMLKEGTVRLDSLPQMSSAQAREELNRLPGVGNKVADCVLLYSGTKYDVFPTDVWVKRVMEELYFKREASFREIQEFSADYFGSLSGFAQQYLFYYARENKIGVR